MQIETLLQCQDIEILDYLSCRADQETYSLLLPMAVYRALYQRIYTIYKNNPSYHAQYPFFDVIHRIPRLYHDGYHVPYFKQCHIALSVITGQNWTAGTFINYFETLKTIEKEEQLNEEWMTLLKPLGFKLLTNLKNSTLTDKIYNELSTVVLNILFNHKTSEILCHEGIVIPDYIPVSELLAIDQSERFYVTVQSLMTGTTTPSNNQEYALLAQIQLIGLKEVCVSRDDNSLVGLEECAILS